MLGMTPMKLLADITKPKYPLRSAFIAPCCLSPSHIWQHAHFLRHVQIKWILKKKGPVAYTRLPPRFSSSFQAGRGKYTQATPKTESEHWLNICIICSFKYFFLDQKVGIV